MPYIYMLTNTINGKKYIGFTNQPVEKRIRQHSHKSNKCPLIKAAIQKYGMSAFEYVVLEHSSDPKDADRFLNVLEPYYIEKYNPEYNRSNGGGGSGATGPRYKLRVPVIQYDMDGNQLKKWDSARQAGKELGILPSSITHVCRKDHDAHCAGGFQWRYASDNLSSLPTIIRKLGKRKVMEIKTQKVFDSVTAASLYANISKPAIIKYCKQGIRWKYMP